MKSIYKYLATAFMMTALAAPASAASSASSDELKVYSNLFGSVVNIVVWEGNQPVSGGTVTIKDKTGRTTAKGTLNSKGRAHIRLLARGYGQEYTVTAESNNMTGTGSLVISDTHANR